MITKNHALGWPPGSTDPGNGTLVFLVFLTGLGLVSTLLALGVVCVKYEASDAMSKNGHSYCGFNMMIVYLGLIYVIISCGAIYVSRDVPSFQRTPSPSTSFTKMKLIGILLQYTQKSMGDAGLRCTGDSLKSYQFCSMLLAIVVLTGIGAGVAVVSAGIEWRRIRQWGKVLERCQLVRN